MSAGLQLEIVRVLASGGFGTVALVQDRRSQARFAAKAIRPEHLRNPKVVARMRDEAALLTRLHHPNIVRVHGLVRIADRPVVLMEWVQGTPLRELIGVTGGLRPADAAEIVATTSEALDAAWVAPDPLSGRPLRVIHRDLKPSNLLLTVDGQVKIVDFGIARGQFEGKAAVTNSMVLGTRDYVAPERLDGDVDHPAGDVFALGMVLYELIACRKLPQSMFVAQHDQRLARSLGRLRPPGLTDRARRQLLDLIAAMCAYDAARRPSHQSVARELRGMLQQAGLSADLPALGHAVVTRLIAPVDPDPQAHPNFLEVAFLEDPSGVAPSEVDERVRALLGRPDWLSRRDELARWLADDPTWTAEPFGELLDLRNPPRWRFWADRLAPAELVAVLELVEPRPDPRILRHARGLAHHPDGAVRGAAERVLRRAVSEPRR